MRPMRAACGLPAMISVTHNTLCSRCMATSRCGAPVQANGARTQSNPTAARRQAFNCTSYNVQGINCITWLASKTVSKCAATGWEGSNHSHPGDRQCDTHTVASPWRLPTQRRRSMFARSIDVCLIKVVKCKHVCCVAYLLSVHSDADATWGWAAHLGCIIPVKRYCFMWCVLCNF